jgi:hypothetical protein
METYRITYRLPSGRILRSLVVAFTRGKAMAQARIEAASLGLGTRIIEVEV